MTIFFTGSGRPTDTIGPQNMDITKRQGNLIAVYEDEFGFRRLREVL